jgi:thymidylate kinase
VTGRAQYVVFEGLDGAGKSSALREVAALLERAGVPFHLERGLATHSATGRFARRHPAALAFLFDQLLWHTFRVRPCLRRGTLVLQDRNLLSVATYFPGCGRWFNRLGVAVCRLATRAPDLLVLLHVPLEERVRRLERSADNVYHRMLLDDPDVIRARDALYAREYDAHRGRKLSFDTSERSAVEVAREVFEQLQGGRLAGKRRGSCGAREGLQECEAAQAREVPS